MACLAQTLSISHDGHDQKSFFLMTQMFITWSEYPCDSRGEVSLSKIDRHGDGLPGLGTKHWS